LRKDFDPAHIGARRIAKWFRFSRLPLRHKNAPRKKKSQMLQFRLSLLGFLSVPIFSQKDSQAVFSAIFDRKKRFFEL
jgi:hypothetical protein